MLGFSYYLNEPITEKTRDYFQSMADHSFQEIFTSLHIPEESDSQKSARMQQLMELAEYCGLSVVVDVDQDALQYLPNNLSAKLTLRLDDGFSAFDIAQISQSMPIALNASTIDQELYLALRQQNVDFNHIEAWHNFYPRPETGLDETWFQNKNQWLKSLGFTVQAFIPGDTDLRGPLFTGLPTLEKHRHDNLLAAAMELRNDFVDKIFIGDPKLSLEYQNKFQSYQIQRTLNLSCTLSSHDIDLTDKIFSNRPDPAADVIRLQESRGLFGQSITSENTVARPIGSITIDNQDYGRYMGEVQITKKALPADPKVNVLGQINSDDLSLIPLIGPNQPLILHESGGMTS